MAAAQQAQRPGGLVIQSQDAAEEAKRKLQRIKDAYREGYDPKREPGKPGVKPDAKGRVSIENQPEYKRLTEQINTAQRHDPKFAEKLRKQRDKLHVAPGKPGGGMTRIEKLAKTFGQA